MPFFTAHDQLCHTCKSMLCVFVEGLQFVQYELLQTGQTVTAELYSQRLERVKQALQQDPALVNRKSVLFLHNNDRPHVTRVDRNTIQRFCWEALCHSNYLPDLVPSDYYISSIPGQSITNEADFYLAYTGITMCYFFLFGH